MLQEYQEYAWRRKEEYRAKRSSVRSVGHSRKNNLPLESCWKAIRVGFVAKCLLYNMPQAVLAVIKSVSAMPNCSCSSEQMFTSGSYFV
jgi:hypothetical protein